MRRDPKRNQPVRQPRSDAEQQQSFAFRRSRTITGSAADTVRAASENRGQLQSSRLHEHSLRKHRRKLSTYLLLSLLACAGLWYVVSAYMGTTISVGTLATQPLAKQLSSERYQLMVASYFNDHPLERFRFALDETTFAEFMRQQAPEVSDARLEKGSGLGTAELALELREPVVAWTIKKQQYFVDATGNAFIENYFAAPTVIVSDKSGINADAGVVASTKLLRFIGRVITLINSAGIQPVEAVELPANSTRQVDFKLKDRSYTIKAHLDRDPAGQAADIVSAVRYVEAKQINPEYLDVRVSSKAFYRDKQ